VARQAQRLAGHPALVGWLYTSTRLMALRVIRTEQRRKAREQEAHTMNELLHDDVPAADWNELRPVIEEAMHDLNEKDRHAVLLRFFENKTLNQVGAVLNLTENAARMRVDRALEKLRGILARRGISTSAGALAIAVSANAVQAAPAGFAATLSGAALAASAAHASAVITVTQTIAMTTLQKTIMAAALAAAVGTGFYAMHRSSQLNARIQQLQQQQTPLLTQVQELQKESTRASNQVAALTEENARLKAKANPAEVLKLRGEVGVLRQRAVSNAAAAQPSGGLAKMLNDPAMKEYMRKAMMDKMKSLYADFISEQKLTPEQTEQFAELLSQSGTKALAQLSGTTPGGTPQPEVNMAQDVGSQMQAVLGDAGAARLKEFSEELPARTTLTLLNGQLSAPLSAEQSASLLQIIKAEPNDLTQGIIGGPDKAFLGSQTEIESFLQQVAQSNQRILQQAAGRLTPDQLATLEGVLAKGLESRKLQGAAFFQKR
jgi:RNA polymerase sigma factor (sigma-70 family)